MLSGLVASYRIRGIPVCLNMYPFASLVWWEESQTITCKLSAATGHKFMHLCSGKCQLETWNDLQTLKPVGVWSMMWCAEAALVLWLQLITNLENCWSLGRWKKEVHTCRHPYSGKLMWIAFMRNAGHLSLNHPHLLKKWMQGCCLNFLGTLCFGV